MLRIGLTGSLGSGKSTVAAILRGLGAQVIEADELGRALMEPGQPVFLDILRAFGPKILTADGRLNRPRLAELAFAGGRLDELNAIVHPAVIAAQRQWMQRLFDADRSTIAVVESALIFEVERDARTRGEREGVLSDWRNRFDKVIVVTAPQEVKIARYVARIARDRGITDPLILSDHNHPEMQLIAADAERRHAMQMSDRDKVLRADYVLANKGNLEDLRLAVEGLWIELQRANR